jgi:lysozyme family protein
MANADLYFGGLMIHEGGFQNDPNDSANYYKGVLIGTKYGVCAETYAQYLGRDVTEDDVRNMTVDDALAVMKQLFWNWVKADQIESQSVAEQIVEMAWSNAKIGIRRVQEVIGVEQDGNFGPVTLNMVNSWDAETLFNKLKKSRIEFINLHTPIEFRRGQIARVNSEVFKG